MLEKNQKKFILTLGTNDNDVDLDAAALMAEGIINSKSLFKAHIKEWEE